jgi:hypothetical protein
MTIDYQKQFKALADRLAREPNSQAALEHRVLRHVWVIDDGQVHARANRQRAIERVVAIFRGRGCAGDTTGNGPRTKRTAFIAIAEHLDSRRRYTTRTNQVPRSFEDTSLKQRALKFLIGGADSRRHARTSRSHSWFAVGSASRLRGTTRHSDSGATT